MRYLRTNTATRITVGPFIDKTDGITPEVALTVTSEKLTFVCDVAGVPTLILDVAPTASGGANDMVHIASDDAGFYDLELAAADVNYVGRAMLGLNDVATHCPVFHEFMIVPAVIYDAMILGTDLFDVSVTQLLGTAWLAPGTAGTPDVNVKLINAVSTSAVTTIKAVQGIAVDGVITTVTNQLTAAAIATGVWQDTTAGDFTTALSIGKTVVNGVTLGTGLTINAYTGNTVQTGNVATLITTVGAAGVGLTNLGDTRIANLDAAVSATATAADLALLDARVPAALTANGNMKSSLVEILTTALTETAGLIAAAFKQFFNVATPTGTMKAITNVVTATNLTNAATAGDLTATMKASVTTAVPTAAAITDAVWDEATADHVGAGTTGLALASAGDPWSTALPAAYGAGTAGFILGTNLNALITSRMATYAQPAGFLAATFPSGTVANTTNITAGTITTTTNLTNLPAAAALEATLTAMKGATFSGSTDSLEALRDRGDAAWITATGFSTHTAADVWGVATRVLTAGTNIALAKGTGVTGFNDIAATAIVSAGAITTSGGAVTLTTAERNAVADQVWDEALAGHVGAGSAGLALGAAAAPSAATVADAVWDEILSGHVIVGSAGAGLAAAGASGDPWSTVVPGAYGVGTAGYRFGNIAAAGAGAITWAYTLTNANTGLPIADADVWVTSDAAGTNVLASGRTNASGIVTFYLDAGQIYVWRQRSGFNFSNPDGPETVS